MLLYLRHTDAHEGNDTEDDDQEDENSHNDEEDEDCTVFQRYHICTTALLKT